MHIERIVGVGAEQVYAYHYPSQRQIMGPYPIKVGHSNGDAVSRIKQTQAAMQEEPVIDLIIKCEGAHVVERFIHARLKESKIVGCGGGREWFVATPEEIEVAWLSMGGPEKLPIGPAIRAIRRKKGMTQVNLGRAAGLRQATISQIECDSRCVKLSTLEECLRELGCRLAVVPLD